MNYIEQANIHLSKANEHNNRAYKIAMDIMIHQNSVNIKDIPKNEYFVIFGEFGIVEAQKLDSCGCDGHCIRSFNSTYEKNKTFKTPIDASIVPFNVLANNKNLMEYYNKLT